MTTITKLLIANRGEIACRVMRTAKAMGMNTVAVYSEADASAPHVKWADEAVCIGPASAAESYLNIENIINAAVKTGANAIHPGYGFLSENAAFAQRCVREGIIFVGPSEQSIEVMGDKARSKRAMTQAGVPCVPGYQGEDQSDDTLIAEAKKIGLPLMVKAAAGGGGRGMRVVDDLASLPDVLKLARSEAQNAFGSGALILEKRIMRPRHVEIQVFGDQHGHVIHLGERDCSVQRRHQKVIEEAPCPVMTPDLRAAMGEAAVNAAKAVDYVGAGTVEFLLDGDNTFYFLEMNTRLQVEHPVTEEVTGHDLVALQLKVAAGEPLGLTQNDIKLSGHAIEVRLYAEDPEKDFLPSTGTIQLWHVPEGPGIRVDDGIESGSTISPYYDPMVAKIIAYGASREEARRRLIQALQGSALIGVQNNRDFLIDALSQSAFVSGEATTAFIADTYGEDGFEGHATPSDLMLAASVHYALRRRQSVRAALDVNRELLDWSSTGHLETVVAYALEGETQTVSVVPQGDGQLRVTLGDHEAEITLLELGENRAVLQRDGRKIPLAFCQEGDHILHISHPTRQYSVVDMSSGVAAVDLEGSGVVSAPMHGMIMEIAVEEGDSVKTGDKLAVLEAMKMQHEIVAKVDGVIKAVATKAGAQIGADDLIMEIDPEG